MPVEEAKESQLNIQLTVPVAVEVEVYEMVRVVVLYVIPLFGRTHFHWARVVVPLGNPRKL